MEAKVVQADFQRAQYLLEERLVHGLDSQLGYLVSDQLLQSLVKKRHTPQKILNFATFFTTAAKSLSFLDFRK